MNELVISGYITLKVKSGQETNIILFGAIVRKIVTFAGYLTSMVRPTRQTTLPPWTKPQVAL